MVNGCLIGNEFATRFVGNEEGKAGGHLPRFLFEFYSKEVEHKVVPW